MTLTWCRVPHSSQEKDSYQKNSSEDIPYALEEDESRNNEPQPLERKYICVTDTIIHHTNSNLPLHSTYCWNLPSGDIIWFFTFAGLVLFLTLNLGNDGVCWFSRFDGLSSGDISSRNSSATSPSSSIFSRLVYHFRPWSSIMKIWLYSQTVHLIYKKTTNDEKKK